MAKKITAESATIRAKHLRKQGIQNEAIARKLAQELPAPTRPRPSVSSYPHAYAAQCINLSLW
jgi:hypothetical protein